MSEGLVKEVHHDIKKLEKLLEESDKIPTPRSARTMPVSRKAIRAHLQHSEHASQTHGQVSQFWERTCRKGHSANPWLQHYSSPVFELQLSVPFAPRSSPWDELSP